MFEKYSLETCHESPFYHGTCQKFARTIAAPSSKRRKKHSTSQETSPVAGTSLLFSHKVLLQRNCLQLLMISSRIPYIALHGPEAPYYLDNSNLHSLPANCTGVLVPYSCSAVGGRLKGSSCPDEVLKATWRQGVIVYHSLSTIVLLTRTLEHHCVSLHNSCLYVYCIIKRSNNFHSHSLMISLLNSHLRITSH